MSITLERTFLLLSVIEKASAHASQYSALIGACRAELESMNIEAQKENEERAADMAKAAEEAKAKEDARLARLAADEEARAKAAAKAPVPNPTASLEPVTRRPIVETPNVS